MTEMHAKLDFDAPGHVKTRSSGKERRERHVGDEAAEDEPAEVAVRAEADETVLRIGDVQRCDLPGEVDARCRERDHGDRTGAEWEVAPAGDRRGFAAVGADAEDLRNAVDALLSGKDIPADQQETRPVGCGIRYNN